MDFQFAQIFTVPLYLDVLKVLTLMLLGFICAFFSTPILTGFLYRNKLCCKGKEKTVKGENAPLTKKLTDSKRGTPLMGGILVWGTVLFLAGFFLLIKNNFTNVFLSNLSFLSRSQTWLPLAFLLLTGLIGLLDDYFSIRGIGKNKGGGIGFFYRLFWLLVIATGGGMWFYFKLNYTSIHLPGLGDWDIGWWYIAYFVLVVVATAVSSNETDGLDGLNGGVLLFSFASFAFIAFFQNKVNLASFCAIICGGLLAFLWFNIYPARFFMGDTGAFALGTTLGVVAMITNSSLVLPIIAFIYVLESLSVIIQLISKKFFKKKVFLVAPIHYHFRAKGWPESKVVMRFWIISIVCSVLGILIGVFGGGKY